MICPECEKQGLRSRINIGSGSTTAMWCPPFYDEDGRFHNHDSNTTTTNYWCSRGHHWVGKGKGSCWCGWPENEKPKEQ